MTIVWESPAWQIPVWLVGRLDGKIAVKMEMAYQMMLADYAWLRSPQGQQALRILAPQEITESNCMLICEWPEQDVQPE